MNVNTNQHDFMLRRELPSRVPAYRYSLSTSGEREGFERSIIPKGAFSLFPDQSFCPRREGSCGQDFFFFYNRAQQRSCNCANRRQPQLPGTTHTCSWGHRSPWESSLRESRR